MNEISSFSEGEVGGTKHTSSLNNPPYSINNQESHQSLSKKTISPDALHYNGLREYNVHNLYG